MSQYIDTPFDFNLAAYWERIAYLLERIADCQERAAAHIDELVATQAAEDDAAFLVGHIGD